MNKLIQIDDLMSECGYGYQDESGINNCYNCNHPNQEDFEYTKDDEIMELRDCIKEFIISKITGRKKESVIKSLKDILPTGQIMKRIGLKKSILKKLVDVIRGVAL